MCGNDLARKLAPKLKLKQSFIYIYQHTRILLFNGFFRNRGFPPILFSSFTLRSSFIIFFFSFQDSMENPHPASRSLKRKPEGDLSQDQTDSKGPCISSKIRKKVLHQVSLLNSAASDCATIKRAIYNLSVLAENGTFVFSLLTASICVYALLNFMFFFLCCFFSSEDLADTLLDCGAVHALVRHLQLSHAGNDDDDKQNKCYNQGVTEHEQFEVAKGCSLIIELLAIKVINFYHFVHF